MISLYSLIQSYFWCYICFVLTSFNMPDSISKWPLLVVWTCGYRFLTRHSRYFEACTLYVGHGCAMWSADCAVSGDCCWCSAHELIWSSGGPCSAGRITGAAEKVFLQFLSSVACKWCVSWWWKVFSEKYLRHIIRGYLFDCGVQNVASILEID
jgi:hypothetical protein